MRYSKLSEDAFTPTRGSPKSAGFYLRSPHNAIIPARGKGVILTDLQINTPKGCYGRIAPRSGMAFFHHIGVGAGVIDAYYRGNVGVLLFSHSDTPFVVNRGDKIAQLICEKIYYPKLELVEELDDTWRGARGFGSTGQS
jgi:dUTP pyrophosphatase